MTTDVALMNSGNSSLMDVDSLFEKFTIKEIHEISKSTQAEIEKKKEDVRQMVGERYRDLIAAADTISEMKITIEQITKNVSSMENKCSSLHRYEISQSKPAATDYSNRKQILEQYYAVTIQIKLLMDFPGKFWSFVENGKFLLAAELFLLAKHIHLNLKMENTKGILVGTWFPIVARQLVITSHFKNSLMQFCETNLKTSDITAEKLTQCLCCLLVLGNNDFQQIFENFLEARYECVENLYKPNQQDVSIREQVCQTIHIIINTFCLVHEVFAKNISEDGSNNLLSQTLENASTHQSPISLMMYLGSPAAKYIPKSVIDFRMSIPKEPLSHAPEYLQKCCSNWIERIVRLINKKLPTLLRYVKNIRGLAVVCDAVWEEISENQYVDGWHDICLRLLLRPFLIWEEVFQSLFLNQVEESIQSHVNAAFAITSEQIFSFLKNKDKKLRMLNSAERNITNFVWSEDDGKLPCNIGWIPASFRKPSDGGSLYMKSKGFTPYTQSLCQTLNSELAKLLDDLESFQLRHNLEKGQEGKIYNFLQNSVLNNALLLVEQCRKFVTDEQAKIESKTDGTADYNFCLVSLSRIWMAMTELCPSLQQSLIIISLPSPVSLPHRGIPKLHNPRNGDDDSAWLKLKSHLLEESQEMMRMWKELIMAHFKHQMSNNVKLWTPEEALLLIPQWDAIKIQEETESGQLVTSTIRVPMQMSILVYSSLIELYNTINCVGSHTLPRPILQEFQTQIMEIVLSSYESLPLFEGMSQTMALQLLFDLQFVGAVCGAKEIKTLAHRLQSFLETIENLIDPFDLDVFTPYIQSNLRQCIQRSSVLLGALISPNRMSLLSIASRSTVSSQQEQNVALSLNVASSRFTLLPLAESLDSTKLNSSKLKKKGIEKSNTSTLSSSATGTISADSTKSTASYLFEAMSSSWFRN